MVEFTENPFRSPEVSEFTDGTTESMGSESSDAPLRMKDQPLRQSRAAQVRANKRRGVVRERQARTELQGRFPEGRVVPEQYLRDASGEIVKDPKTGKGRRIDFTVIEGGEVQGLYEVTSETASKSGQMAKEARIRDAGGTFVRDPASGKLLDVSDVNTEVMRRQ